ncbi:MAG: AsmA family protein [Proteobacteria bacterium]|nr:AsmA family protein [Pseudomonadota bacterium]
MRLKKVLVGLAALVMVVVGAAVALAVVAVFVIDPDDYRDEIAQELESATGRKVTFGGPIAFSLSLIPTLAVSDVTFANASWGSRPEMASIKRLSFQVALVPLLHGVLHVQSMTIEGADVLLETDGQGKGNWALGDTTSSGSGSGSGSDSEVRIDSLDVVDSVVTWRDGASGQERKVEISKASFEADAPDAPMAIDAAIATKEGAVTIKGTVDSLASLRAGRESTIDLVVTAPEVNLTGKGTVGALSGETPFDLAIALDVSALDMLGELGLLDLPVDGPLSFAAHLTGVPAKLQFDDLKFAVAGTNLSGTLTADIGGERPAFSGDLSADSIDLAKWIGEGGTSDQGDRLFPDDTIPLAWMGAVDADLKLKVGRLDAAGLVFKDVSSTVSLASSRLKLSPFSLGVENSTVDGDYTLDGAASPPASTLKLTSKGFDMGALLKQSDVTEALTGTADIDIDVSGSGASMAATMAALDGKVSMVMTDGSVQEQGLDLFLGGVRALVGGLFEKNSGSAKLSCLAAAWDVKDGLATQSVLLIDTQYSTLTGKGTIDLGKETIDETLTPNAKGVSLDLAVPVNIGGTLMDPTATPDEGALALKVGSLIGSVFFPPAALLGLSDLGIGADHPCVLANAPGGDGSGGGISTGSVVDGAGAAVEGAADAVGDAIDDVGKGLGDLFGD